MGPWRQSPHGARTIQPAMPIPVADPGSPLYASDADGARIESDKRDHRDGVDTRHVRISTVYLCTVHVQYRTYAFEGQYIITRATRLR